MSGVLPACATFGLRSGPCLNHGQFLLPGGADYLLYCYFCYERWRKTKAPTAESLAIESFAQLGERVTLEKRDGLWRMEATGDNGKRQIKTVAKELDWTLDMVRAFLDARGA